MVVANGNRFILLPETNATAPVMRLFALVEAIVEVVMAVVPDAVVVLYVTPPEISHCAGKLRVRKLEIVPELVLAVVSLISHDASNEQSALQMDSRRVVFAPAPRSYKAILFISVWKRLNDPVLAAEYAAPWTNPAISAPSMLICPLLKANGVQNGSKYQVPIPGAERLEFVFAGMKGAQ